MNSPIRGLRRQSTGLSNNNSLDKLGNAPENLKLPQLVTRDQISQSGEGLRVLLRRPTLQRRGAGRLLELLDAELESRAAQDLDGPLADRIVAKALRGKNLTFQYQNDQENRPLLQVDFLVSGLNPPLALDIRERDSGEGEEQRNPDGGSMAALAASYGYRYASIAESEVLGDELEFERELERVIGSSTGILPYPTNSNGIR